MIFPLQYEPEKQLHSIESISEVKEEVRRELALELYEQLKAKKTYGKIFMKDVDDYEEKELCVHWSDIDQIFKTYLE